MSIDIRRNPDGTAWRDPVTGKFTLEMVPDPPEPEDERWRDQVCFLCGERESWFRCMMAYDMAFCSECLPDTHRLSRISDAAEWIVLTMLARRLWKESHAVRLR